MAEQFAGLTLGVNVEQLNKAVKSLQDFKQANDGAKKSVEDFVDTEQVAKQRAKELADQLAKQNKEFRNIQSAIDPTADKMDRLRKAASQLDTLWKKGIVPDDSFFELGSMLETQQNKLLLTKKALTEEGRAALEESKNKARAVAEGKKFIAALQEQAAAAGKTRAELLEMKAAQLGVSAEAAPFVERLRAQEKQMKLTGISAGQYSQAMKMLPMQITDVVTSLASGMPVWMVAIQQGGQIKDSFGGIGNTFKVLLSYLNPLNVSIGLAAAGLGALAFATIKARNEIKEANEAVRDGLGLTGDFADRLALNIRNIAKESNQTAKEVTEAFINTTDGASESIDKLINVGFSYDEARRKVESYKGSSDFRGLNADIEQHRLQVLGIRDAWSDAAEEVKNYYTGAEQGKQSVALGGAIDPVVKIIENAKRLQEEVNTARIEGNRKVKETVDLIKQEYLASDQVASATQRLADARKYAKTIQQSGDKEAIAQAEKLIQIRKRELDEAQKAQEKRAKGAKTTGAGRSVSEQLDKELYVLQAQLATLKEHRTVNDVISQQRKALWSIEKQIQILEDAQTKRKLTAGEQNLLNEQKAVLEMAKQKAELGDQIALQERKNKLEQNSIKFIQEQAAAIEAIKQQQQGKSDRVVAFEQEIAQIRAAWQAQGGDLDDQLLEDEIKKVRERYAEEENLRGNWLAGAKKAWAEYEEDAKNVYAGVGDIAGAALSGLTDQMTEFLTTGKASFADFANSIIKMIVKMIMQMVIFNSLSGFFGGGKAITMGSLLSGFATGGYTGDGGKYEPKGIVHGGEFVFTKEATQRIGTKNLYRLMRGYANGGQVGASVGGSGTISGGSSVSFGDINVDINNGNDPKGMETGVRMIVTEMMKRACTQGGEIYEFVMAKRG
jgi:lambda family phage tail tape measure protein